MVIESGHAAGQMLVSNLIARMQGGAFE